MGSFRWGLRGHEMRGGFSTTSYRYVVGVDKIVLDDVAAGADGHMVLRLMLEYLHEPLCVRDTAQCLLLCANVGGCYEDTL
jgi:hypothetical protein